jgi:DNA-binding IscR family transcriptional regulator
LKLQKNTRLALYSVLEFALDPTRHVAAAEIATKYGVSPHHLAKVLSSWRAQAWSNPCAASAAATVSPAIRGA